MKVTLGLLGFALSIAAVAAPGDRAHLSPSAAAQKAILAPTLRDALELEEVVLEREPGFFAEADQAKRAQLLAKLLPTLADDRTLPERPRQRLAKLDPNAATQILEGTATAREGWARQALAEGDASPRATARAKMLAAAARTDTTLVEPGATMERWMELEANAGSRQPRTRGVNREPAVLPEKGLFDRGKPSPPGSVF